MIRWTPAFWRMRLPEKHHGFHEMPKIASMKSRLCRASCTLACITGSMGNCRSYSRLSRKSRPSNKYALVPLTRSEPDANVSTMEHRQKVDDILRDAWRGIDGYDTTGNDRESGDFEMDGGFSPTTYGELTPSGARHLARAMGIDQTDAKPFGGISS